MVVSSGTGDGKVSSQERPISAPKVFLSHASEDKARFVTAFAERLRANGVDAWVDQWEMLPGDSLVDKIFEEGLKEASAIIIVLSKNSVAKPWVREELNSGIVARLDRGARLIPVVIDKCDIPDALKTTLWEPIDNLTSYDNSFDRILASIFETSIKPPLGKAPGYTSEILQNIDGLQVVDNVVLKLSGDFLLDHPDAPLDPEIVFHTSKPNVPPRDEIVSSLEILDDEGYLSVSYHSRSGPDDWGCYYRMTLQGFEKYCRAYVSGYGELVDRCAGLIVNDGARTNHELRDSLGIPLMIANHVLGSFRNNAYVELSKTLGERISITRVSAKLRRALQ